MGGAGFGAGPGAGAGVPGCGAGVGAGPGGFGVTEFCGFCLTLFSQSFRQSGLLSAVKLGTRRRRRTHSYLTLQDHQVMRTIGVITYWCHSTTTPYRSNTKCEITPSYKFFITKSLCTLLRQTPIQRKFSMIEAKIPYPDSGVRSTYISAENTCINSCFRIGPCSYGKANTWSFCNSVISCVSSSRRLQSCPLQTVSLNGSAMLSFVSMLLFVCHWAVHEWNITGTSLTMSGLDACLARASVNHEVHVFTHEGFGCAPCMHGPPYPSHCTFMGKLWFVFSFFPCALMWDALIPVAASSPIFPPCYQCPFFFVFGYRGPYYFSSRLMSINHAKKEPYKSLYPGTCFICKMSKYLCSCTIFLRAIFFGSPRKKFPHGKGAWW